MNPTTQPGAAVTHTAGDWLVMQSSEGALDVCVVRDGIRSVICRSRVEHLAPEHGGSVAGNTRLMSASPDLLSALTLMARAVASGNREDLARAEGNARAAIARAGGSA